MNVSSLIPWRRNRGSIATQEAPDPFAALHREMNRLFDDFWRAFDGAQFGDGRGVRWPEVDVDERDDEVVVSAELPGLDEKDIEVSLRDDVLTIRGERKVEHEDARKHLSERYYGRFERTIPLGIEVEGDKARASFGNGVLTVTIPKSADARHRVRRIPIAQG